MPLGRSGSRWKRAEQKDRCLWRPCASRSAGHRRAVAHS